MIQRSEVLTRENNRISVISAGGTTMQKGYVIIAEREIPVNTLEQSWMFEFGEMTRASRTSTKLVSTLGRTVAWLSHLGSGKIDESRLESRHGIHHDLRAKNIGF